MSTEPSGWTRLADLVLRTRGLGGLFGALFLAGLAALPLLRFDFSPQTLFDETSERARLYRAYRAEYGADDHVLFVLVQGDTAKADTWAVVDELRRQVEARVPAVERQGSLLTLPVPRSPEPGLVVVEPLVDGPPATDAEAARLAARAREHPLLRDTLISRSGRVASAFLKVDDDVARMADIRPVVAELRAILGELEGAHPDVALHLLGPHAYRVSVVQVMVREELKFIPLTGLVLMAILWLTFRSVAGVLIPLLSVALGTTLSLAFMAVTGEHINIINTITATLILVIGAADAIHLIARYQHERLDGVSREESVRRALTFVGGACLLTSVTTAAGFATLGTAHLAILRRFGLYAAAGVMITFFVTIVFVPWALARWPVEPRVTGRANAEGSPLLRSELRAVAGVVLRRRNLVLALSALVGLFFLAGVPRTRVDNFIMEYVPREDPILAAHHLLEEELAGIVHLDLLLEVPAEAGVERPWHDPDLLRRAAALERRLLDDPFVQASNSVLGLLRELRWVTRGGEASGLPRDALPESAAETAQLLLLAEMGDEDSLVNTHLRDERRLLRVTLRADDLGAREYLLLEERMKGWAAEAFDGAALPVRTTVTGTSQVGYGGIDMLIRDLLGSLGYAFCIIFATLALLFRSVRLAALAMIPNMLPVLVVLGGMGWAGRHLETLSAMVFSIGLGIAVDDTIHYVARWAQERRAGAGVEEAIRVATEGTGKAILYTSVLLLAGFGVLYTSAFPPNRMFAVLAGAVIASALVADLLLLPALLLLFRPSVR